MKEIYCHYCKKKHTASGWKAKDVVINEGGDKEFVWFCDKWFRSTPVEFMYNPAKKERVNEQREKYKADLEQPFMSNRPNNEFIRVHKGNKELLNQYFTHKELRDSGV